MDRESKHGLMAPAMKGSTKKGKNMEEDSMCGVMDPDTREIGLTTRSMATVCTPG